jgi:hypothetical protein
LTVLTEAAGSAGEQWHQQCGPSVERLSLLVEPIDEPEQRSLLLPPLAFGCRHDAAKSCGEQLSCEPSGGGDARPVLAQIQKYVG